MLLHSSLLGCSNTMNARFTKIIANSLQLIISLILPWKKKGLLPLHRQIQVKG
jgi:hypothetical protein